MTRKDFERIAQVFRVNNQPHSSRGDSYADATLWQDLLDDMCIELQAMNPRFDEARFRAACKKGQQDVC